ncbi:MAG: Crp/Fnr family transcriptional regulator [Desulfovibrionaceae bacterium]|nr:Crp/Fnr family transcriptional regulator [Desulfovibrionaceae bacterium]
MAVAKYNNENMLISDEAMEKLMEIGTEVFLPAGSRVHNDRIHILLEGSCSLCIYPPSGEQSTLIFFEPGMMLNFVPCLLKRQRLHAITKRRMVKRSEFAVRVRCDSRCLAIEPDDFLEALKDSLPLNAMLVHALTENVLNLLSLASNSPLMPASQRVCRFLSEIVGSDHPQSVPVKLTYSEIATHLGVHSITVAKIFKKLKEESIVEKKGRSMYIRDAERLHRIAQGVEGLGCRAKGEDGDGRD